MKTQVTLAITVLFCLAGYLQAKEDCSCQFFMEGGTDIRNFVYGKGFKLNDFCDTLGEEYCIDFCKSTYAELPHENGRTFTQFACGNMARDVYRRRVELYAQSCDGIIRPTGLITNNELCCRGTEPYDCPSD